MVAGRSVGPAMAIQQRLVPLPNQSDHNACLVQTLHRAIAFWFVSFHRYKQLQMAILLELDVAPLSAPREETWHASTISNIQWQEMTFGKPVRLVLKSADKSTEAVLL